MRVRFLAVGNNEEMKKKILDPPAKPEEGRMEMLKWKDADPAHCTYTILIILWLA